MSPKKNGTGANIQSSASGKVSGEPAQENEVRDHGGVRDREIERVKIQTGYDDNQRG